jgi:hypothetical protein
VALVVAEDLSLRACGARSTPELLVALRRRRGLHFDASTAENADEHAMDESSSVVIYDMAKVRAVRILNVRGTGIGAAGDGVEATSALAMAAMAKRASEAAALATSALTKRASEAVALVTLDASSHAAPKSAGAEPPVAHQLPCGGAWRRGGGDGVGDADLEIQGERRQRRVGQLA